MRDTALDTQRMSKILRWVYNNLDFNPPSPDEDAADLVIRLLGWLLDDPVPRSAMSPSVTDENPLAVAGHECNALVAEKVMGWNNIVVSDIGAFGHPPVLVPRHARIPVPHYSTDIRAAWTIVDNLADYCVVIEHTPGYEWEVMLDQHRVFFNARAETLPLAICRAALDALGAV